MASSLSGGRRWIGGAFALVLLAACARVAVTPLGTTADGRRQFAITCNVRASSDGSCHDRAVRVCGGSYETQSISNTGPRSMRYEGQVHDAAAERVLLVACNPRSVSAQGDSSDRI